MSMAAMWGEKDLRTLTARIHSAFWLVVSALHSLRMAGFLQEYGL